VETSQLPKKKQTSTHFSVLQCLVSTWKLMTFAFGAWPQTVIEAP
jgi:hypothetical protein